MKPFVANMVITTSFGSRLDLLKVKDAFPDGTFPWCRYERRRFSGAIIRFSNPLVTILLFAKWKAVAAGCSEIEHAKITFNKLNDTLQGIGYVVQLGELIIQNVVLASRIEGTVDLVR